MNKKFIRRAAITAVGLLALSVNVASAAPNSASVVVTCTITKSGTNNNSWQVTATVAWDSSSTNWKVNGLKGDLTNNGGQIVRSTGYYSIAPTSIGSATPFNFLTDYNNAKSFKSFTGYVYNGNSLKASMSTPCNPIP